MITNIRIFDYSHDVQFKVCAIIMLKRYQPHPTPRKPHTHTHAHAHTHARAHTHAHAHAHVHAHAHTHTHNVLHISYKDAFTQTQHELCVFHCIYSLTPPDRPYTHPYTDEPHPSWSSTQKDSSGHCSCLYDYVCSAVCALCSKLPDCFQIRPSWRQRYPIACSCTFL